MMNRSEVDESLEFLRTYIARPSPTPAKFHPTAMPSDHMQFINHGGASASGLPNQRYSFGAVPGGPLLSALNTSPAVQRSGASGSPAPVVWPQSEAAAVDQSITNQTPEQRMQFMAVLSFLRKRYVPLDAAAALHVDAVNPSSSSSIGAMSDGEIALMIDGFSREARNVIHKERTWQSQIRDGSSKRVNFPPEEILHQSVSHAKTPPPSPRGSKKDAGEDNTTEEPPPPTPSRRRALKEGMKLLRKGEGVVKFSTSGKPQRRFLRVLDRRTRGQGDSAATIPHLCWSTSSDAEPSATSQLSLLSLEHAHLKKLSGIVRRGRDGLIHADTGEEVSLDCCLMLSFERRGSLDLAFRSAEVAKRWYDVCLLVIDKNAKLATKGNTDDDA